MAVLSIGGLTARDEASQASGYDLDVADGELVALTALDAREPVDLLRLVAGLDHAGLGCVVLGDRTLDAVPVERREIAMIFRGGALYPHLTARDNVAFALRARRTRAAEVDARVEELARILSIQALLAKKPAALDPEQTLQVALARALATRPKLLLVEDPFAALAPQARARARLFFAAIQRELAITTLFAASSTASALSWGGRVAVLSGGDVVQVGLASELYAQPATKLIASLVGEPPMNLLELPVEDGHVSLGGARIATPVAERVVLGIRAEHLSFDPIEDAFAIGGVVRAIAHAGGEVVVSVSVGERTLTARCAVERAPRPGAAVLVRVAASRVWFFDAGPDGRILTTELPAAPADVVAAEGTA